MPNGIKTISKSTTDKLISCYRFEKNFELAVLFLDGNFYDIGQAEPLDVADFIQLHRYKKIAMS